MLTGACVNYVEGHLFARRRKAWGGTALESQSWAGMTGS